ncbi:MAG: hypothetical protein ACYYK0_01055 [Candidatus Eutrophobiaceae bacterium]
MLPVTHGSDFTRLHILLYTILAQCPVAYCLGCRLRMSRLIYPDLLDRAEHQFCTTPFACSSINPSVLPCVHCLFNMAFKYLQFGVLLVDHYVLLIL